MGWIIFIIIILCILGSSNNTTADTTPTVTRRSSKKDSLSRKDIRRIKKAYRQAEMDAFEDMIMYMEEFSDD